MSLQRCRGLEEERSAIEKLRENFNDYDYVKHQLSNDVTSQITDKHETLKRQHDEITRKERQYYSIYTTGRDAILAQKEQIVNDVIKEREQLAADDAAEMDGRKGDAHAQMVRLTLAFLRFLRLFRAIASALPTCGWLHASLAEGAYLLPCTK